MTVTSATADGGATGQTSLVYTPGHNNTNVTAGAAAPCSGGIPTITEGVYWEQDTFAGGNCWYSAADPASSTGSSSSPISIQQFQARNPTAVITQIALTDGGGVGTQGPFSTSADELIIGFRGSRARYDFGG